MPIVITGFPDRDGFRQYVDDLTDTGVRLVEIVDPVSWGWTHSTNEVIRDAHRAALRHALPDDGPNTAKRFIGSLKVIYEGSIASSVETYVASCDGLYSILQFALAPELIPASVVVPHTTMVGVGDLKDELVRSVTQARWMIVCQLSDRTGGALPDFGQVLDRLAFIRSMSDLPLFCTFGVSTPETVERLRLHRACDGVIVGTVFLERLRQGAPASRAVVRELYAAACG
jgi:tryptophan synthase alpha subunit